ncbi:GH15176 [Drosophila grimshawi]|uniref:GH15176 n=1 Tax=Drosophila grimshawi TaxID=7222 RepID=B4IXV4_DROGR|nr:GH15176 [Drosophila grimshawi]
MIFNTSYLLALCLLCATQIVCHAKTIKKAEANLLRPLQELSPWQGKWFPYAPGEPHVKPKKLQHLPTWQTNAIPKNNSDPWQGKWFPYAPGEPHIPKREPSAQQTKDSWQGKWFPQAPGEPHLPKTQLHICDDGVHNLSVDYDPEDIRENSNYLCLNSNRSLFSPNLNTEALLTQHFLPSAYVPPSKCLNESIAYTHIPPTNGAFRPLPAVYGSYKYLPPQRYMRNLAEGAIVMLYHPCAYQGQVEQLQHIVAGCLYRHLVTPSQLLTPERPLALLAWRHSLSMSVVDRQQVGQFIRMYAKLGPLAVENLARVVEQRETYKASLLTEARLVTDLDDSELCGYMEEEQHM